MQPNRARCVRVLIAADHPPSTDKIRGLVFPDFEIVGTVKAVGERALRRAFELKPDVILVEVAEAIKDDFKVVTTLSQRLPRTWIILFQNGTDSPVREASADEESQELSGREYEVLALLAAGYPMKEIAFRLGITYRTVTFHKYKMMERLGVSTNAGLIAYALKNASTNMGQREPAGVA
jgi:DNA-binding NarL/FixJ family response regulator